MTVLTAIAKVMALAAFITTMLGKAAQALEPHCYPQKVFNGKVWYTVFIPASFPSEQNDYCNNIWAQLMINGQINATDPGWFACEKCKISGWEGPTQLSIADEPSGAGWVGRWLQATFPQNVSDANICGRSFPTNAITTCQLFNVDGNITNTTISISSSIDSVLIGRAGAQLSNDFPNDKQSWYGSSSNYKILVGANLTDMYFVTARLTDITSHQEMLGRAWPGLTFNCVAMNTTSV